MNGGWFWWGASCSGFTPADYKKLFQLTVDYIKDRTTSVLFCWSPNSPVNATILANYYPGDAYVDILGLDMYEITASAFRQYMGTLVDYAQAHDKIAVLSETGYRNDTGNGEVAAKYWNDTVLPAIVNDPTGKAIKIAWALTWINSAWSHPYVPHAASTTLAKQSFNNFKNSPHVKFSHNSPNLYQPLVVVSIDDERLSEEVEIYVEPDKGFITIKTKSLIRPIEIGIYEVSGKEIVKELTPKNEITFSIEKLMIKPGIYIVKITSGTKSTVQKIYVQ
jgi:hypothetical protein